MNRIRVLVVDDSAVFRRLLTVELSADPELWVVGTANNGAMGIERVKDLRPDVVVLDVEMPELDGLQTLALLRKSHPDLPVIMFSSQTEHAARATVDALLAGAVDCVAKPSGGDSGSVIRRDLATKIKKCVLDRSRLPPAPTPASARPTPSGRPSILAIGASTGGPNALAAIFAALPKNMPVPVVVVQHMPPMFTTMLAERLRAGSQIPVHEAKDGSSLEPGVAWIAPGDFHLEVVPGAVPKLRLTKAPPENSCRPSVDVLFRSVSEVYRSSVLAVVLTGMGEDGLEGAKLIRSRGGRVWAQDEASSVVWGMPGVVAKAGLAEAVMPLPLIGPELSWLFGPRMITPSRPAGHS